MDKQPWYKRHALNIFWGFVSALMGATLVFTIGNFREQNALFAIQEQVITRQLELESLAHALQTDFDNLRAKVNFLETTTEQYFNETSDGLMRLKEALDRNLSKLSELHDLVLESER